MICDWNRVLWYILIGTDSNYSGFHIGVHDVLGLQGDVLKGLG